MPGPLTDIAWGAAIAIVLIAALVDAMIRARRLSRQRTLDDLRALSWQQFEEVIAAAYRVQETGGRGTADGGVDHVLTRDGERTVGQAKHWRSQRVGVTLVRELYDVQRAMQVSPAMFVAVGTVQGLDVRSLQPHWPAYSDCSQRSKGHITIRAQPAGTACSSRHVSERPETLPTWASTGNPPIRTVPRTSIGDRSKGVPGCTSSGGYMATPIVVWRASPMN